DYYSFLGKKGQRVVASCLTSSIDSKLPAEVQIVALANGVGKRLAYNRNYSGNDAVCDATLPEDGEYFVRVCCFTYTQGGPDYFYRLTIGTAPWIDAIHPPVVEAGQEAQVTIYGRNLPGGVLDPKMTFDDRPLEKLLAVVKAPAGEQATRLAYTGYVPPLSGLLDGFEYRVKNGAGVSNPYLLGVAQAPVVLDAEANDAPSKAQVVPVPCEIAGRVDRRDDRDYYRFQARKGQVLGIEAFADRLGAAMDVQFTLYNAKGDKLIDLDDNPDVLAPTFFNRSDDPPRYRFTVPEDGDYTLLVVSKDATNWYGTRFLYAIRIAPEQPDFRVVVMPATTSTAEAVNLGQGGNQALTVLVQRLGGFTGDVTLAGAKLPPGITVRPQVVAGNQKQAAIVVSAAAEAAPFAGPVELVATAKIDGKTVTRAVRPASITWSLPLPNQQQNTPTVSRLDRELVLALRDKAPYRLSADTTKITVLQGDKITVPVKLTPLAPDFKGTVQLSALALPVGMVMQPVTVNPGQEVKVSLDSKGTVLPGNYTLVLRGQTQPPNPNQQPNPKAPRNLIEAAPPIDVTIVPRQLAKVTVPAAAVKVKAGAAIEVPIKVSRQYDYAGSFKVEVDAKSSKGVRAAEATIAPGAEEVVLKLSTDADLKAGANLTVNLRITALFNDTLPVVHDAKLALNVVK
ncbi:MAG: PPC domain-containing protein, partial [Gemmataceae bacterium]|nr:PPC domain-containing protein [Gemmataceae bacterium]